MHKNLAFLAFASVLLYACNHHGEDSDTASVPTDAPVLNYTIGTQYPHDTLAFTQGLEFYKGELYEGTGEEEDAPLRSELRKLDLATGKVLKKIDLDKKYFGEGITFFDDKIYQLTWQSHVVFQYDLDFKLLKTFQIPTEGWGLTHDHQYLIVSDGSSKIYFRDPTTLDTVRTINVSNNNGLVNNLNELEYIKGYIYANVWQTDYIVKIDPATGKVIGKADFTDLLKHHGLNVYDLNDVLNGIAYDSVTNKTYITGKRWPAMFEVQFK
jgi:glutamine cyclotransferase